MILSDQYYVINNNGINSVVEPTVGYHELYILDHGVQAFLIEAGVEMEKSNSYYLGITAAGKRFIHSVSPTTFKIDSRRLIPSNKTIVIASEYQDRVGAMLMKKAKEYHNEDMPTFYKRMSNSGMWLKLYNIKNIVAKLKTMKDDEFDLIYK